MRPLLLLIAAFFFLRITAPAQPPSPALGSVSGHVFCSDTRTPCRFASVTIQAAPPPPAANSSPQSQPQLQSQSPSFSASTDMDGAFLIRSVPPGDYYILGRLSGYISPYDLASSEFQGDSPVPTQALDIALVRITVSPNQTASSDLTLSRGASLSGTVRFDDGGPAINLPVHLFRKTATGDWKPYSNGAGTSSFAPLSLSSHTDDRGHFYEPGLPPGTYIVEATLPEYSALPSTIFGYRSPSSLSINVIPGGALRVFSGNKYKLRDATPIELHATEDRSDILLDIPTTGLHLLRGNVSSLADGESVSAGTVRLLDPDDKSSLRETHIGADGGFSFNYVLSGQYLIEITALPDRRSDRAPAGYDPFTAPLLVQSDNSTLTYSLTPTKH